jgi:integrase/recombinase XerC
MSHRQLSPGSIPLFTLERLGLISRDVRSDRVHSLHKNLSMLIRYDDGRQQLHGKAAKTLADAILERDVD